MKAYMIILAVLLSGCTANITASSFIYQDKTIEKHIDLNKISSKLKSHSPLITLSEVTLTTQDGALLKGIKLLRKDARINMVFFGGNGMKVNKSHDILNHFALLPANIVWLDYRGVGASEGMNKLTILNLQKDALSVFDFANVELPKGIPVAVHGLSMGSLLASYVANERDLDALILDSAISSLPELVDNLVPGWAKLFYTVKLSKELKRINNINLIKNYKNPLLFLVGKNDSITPMEFSQELYDVSGSSIKELIFIENTNHGETMKKDEAIKGYKRFIEKLTCCESG